VVSFASGNAQWRKLTSTAIDVPKRVSSGRPAEPKAAWGAAVRRRDWRNALRPIERRSWQADAHTAPMMPDSVPRAAKARAALREVHTKSGDERDAARETEGHLRSAFVRRRDLLVGAAQSRERAPPGSSAQD
jgi:hypothetical protein